MKYRVKKPFPGVRIGDIFRESYRNEVRTDNDFNLGVYFTCQTDSSIVIKKDHLFNEYFEEWNNEPLWGDEDMKDFSIYVLTNKKVRVKSKQDIEDDLEQFKKHYE